MDMRARMPVTFQALAMILMVLLHDLPALAGEGDPGESTAAVENHGIDDQNLPSPPPTALLVEWFGLNVGAGYISNTESYLKIDATLFTVSRENWYCTIVEGGLNPVFGVIGVGARAGWQKYLTKSLALRAGLKLGYARWLRGDPGNEHRGWADGIELAPHLQLVWLFPHTSVGIGIDFPIMTAVSGLEWDGPIDARDIDGGVIIYFRWSAF